MTDVDPGQLERRVLVLAPTGRDAAVTCEVLGASDIAAEPCQDMVRACEQLSRGAGALVIAEEALTSGALALLTDALRKQPPWSDIPILVSTASGETTDARVRTIGALDPSGNVTVLERPIRVFTMVVSVHAMLRARSRQYQMRDMLLAMEDQMARLQTERELRARFVSMLAHDLRGPVSAAMVAAELVARRADQVEQRRDYALRIKRNLERVEHMVRNLLDTTRIQAGHALPLKLEACELVGIAQDVADELNLAHPGRVRVRGATNIQGVWSAAELHRALWNLASNAIKYGAAESPVTINVQSTGMQASVSVHNLGNPIPAEHQSRIFEPFARTSAAEAGSRHGWGLGLTLVRGCVEAHGGSIEVTSNAEAGTTFSILLPLDSREAYARTEAPCSMPPLELGSWRSTANAGNGASGSV